jgi:hypothetical protein
MGCVDRRDAEVLCVMLQTNHFYFFGIVYYYLTMRKDTADCIASENIAESYLSQTKEIVEWLKQNEKLRK